MSPMRLPPRREAHLLVRGRWSCSASTAIARGALYPDRVARLGRDEDARASNEIARGMLERVLGADHASLAPKLQRADLDVAKRGMSRVRLHADVARLGRCRRQRAIRARRVAGVDE